MSSLDTLDILDRLAALEDDDDVICAEDEDLSHKGLLSSLGVDENHQNFKDKKKQRSEATKDVSIYSLKSGSKVKVKDLVANIGETVSVNVLKKRLSRLENSNVQLSALLPKITTDKIERNVAYEESSEKVSKWDEVVSRNRKAEQLKFPLKHENMHIRTVDEYVKKFKPKTQLEQQIYTLLKGNKFEENPETGLSKAEEEVLKSVSLQEAKRRRAELQKHRALLSYHEAKNKRTSKIKSRRHLRIIRKRKEKKSSEEFEKLQKTDPEQAAEKLKLAQKNRAEERAVLRHRQGSKWAKNRMLVAKYNEMTKVQLQEQRKLHGELVQKNLMRIESSDEEEENKDTEVNPLVQPTASMPAIYLPRDNPWLRQTPKSADNKSTKEIEKILVDAGPVYKRSENAVLGLQEVSQNKEGVSSDDEFDDEEDIKRELSELKEKKRLREIIEEPSKMEKRKEEELTDSIRKESIQNFRDALTDLKKHKQKIREEKVETQQDEGVKDEVLEEDGLEIGLERRSNLADLENVLQSEKEIASLSELYRESKTTKTLPKKTEQPKKVEKIKANKVFAMETNTIKSETPTLVENDENTQDEENRMTIQEAFADDDVLADFVAEKNKIIDDSKPKPIDLTLPGWGEWAGADIKPSRRKRRRFTIKAKPAPLRKDSHLGPVIINENRDIHIAKHQIRQIPYGFSSYEQYERSIRQPIGKTWNTPATFKSLTKPKVSTVMGAVIDPMDEADAFDSTKNGNRKRTLQKDGQIGFGDVLTPEGKHFKRKKGNKKHKK